MRKIEAITIVLAIGMMVLSGCSNTEGQKAGASYTLHPIIPMSDSNDTDDNSTDHGKQNDIPEGELSGVKAEYIEKIPPNWYIRIVAEDVLNVMRSSDAQLGELDESDAVMRHTLKALPPYGSHYLDVVFRNPKGVEEGNYKSSFQCYEQDSRVVWRFVVRCSDTNATIRLGWRGIYVLDPYYDTENRRRYKEYRSLHNPLSYHMKFIDTKTDEEIAAIVNDIPQHYVFNMDGATERVFEWILKPDLVVLKKKRKSAPAVNLKNRKKQIFQHSYKKQKVFDLSYPPK